MMKKAHINSQLCKTFYTLIGYNMHPKLFLYGSITV